MILCILIYVLFFPLNVSFHLSSYIPTSFFVKAVRLVLYILISFVAHRHSFSSSLPVLVIHRLSQPGQTLCGLITVAWEHLLVATFCPPGILEVCDSLIRSSSFWAGNLVFFFISVSVPMNFSDPLLGVSLDGTGSWPIGGPGSWGWGCEERGKFGVSTWLTFQFFSIVTSIFPHGGWTSSGRQGLWRLPLLFHSFQRAYPLTRVVQRRRGRPFQSEQECLSAWGNARQDWGSLW